jgi:hypothetical protein
MKLLIIALLAVSLSTAATGRAAELGFGEVGVVDTSGVVSSVLTVQGRTRQASVTGPASPVVPAHQELDVPAWSRGRVWLHGISMTIACNALGTVCGSVEAPPPSPTPPGGEFWRLKGCTAPNTCPAWMYPPP